MRRDRDEAMNLFDLVPALGMTMDPVLLQLDTRLDDDRLFQAVHADVARRRPRTLLDGRPSTPVEVILRRLVVKHVSGWSDEATERWVSESLVLRQVCRVYAEAVPADTTLIRWAHLIQPATLQRRLDHVVTRARARNVTRGRQLRLDGTVVATNMHHPTDRTLLDDGVRVLGRTLTSARNLLQATPALARARVRARTRRAKRQMQRIMAAARQRGTAAADRRQTASQHLLALARATVRQAQQVGPRLRTQTTPAAQRVAVALDHRVPLASQVVPQTTRRVLQREAVPAPEQLVRRFEPHTAMIRKGKPGHPTECGRVIWVDEVAGGLLSRYAVLEGKPAEEAQWPPSLDHHRQVFNQPPRLLAGDRGVDTAANAR